ncbi:MAG: chemotaxis protein CheW [Calditrichaeota bacterium]|nr:chemotaxis protein CheW [Calditrichota bacterium]
MDEEIYQMVSFILNEEEFGVDILKVQEIIKMVELTRVPNAPDFVEGVINLRGRIVPVIDLRKRFGLPSGEVDKNTRIVIASVNDLVVGFLVDKVREVLRVPKAVIEPPPDLTTSIHTDYITGVAKLDDRLLIILDLERILMASEKQELAHVDRESKEILIEN